MWHKLVTLGIDEHGKMCQALKSIYSNVQNSVRINNCKSALFEQSGFKQGCTSSPIRFSLYMNEMLTELDKAQWCVSTEGANVLTYYMLMMSCYYQGHLKVYRQC